MSKEVLLRKLQALNLIAVDLKLFLDTHPGNKEALEEIIYIYFFMKGQRNAANHADGKKNGFEYADICEVLTYLVKKLKMQNEKRKG